MAIEICQGNCTILCRPHDPIERVWYGAVTSWFNKARAGIIGRRELECTRRQPRMPIRVIDGAGGRGGVAARGLLWMLAQTASGRAASFLGQIVLARLLLPDDFGTIGLTYTLTTIIGSLTASGIGDVLVQRSRTYRIWAWPGLLIDLTLASIGALLVIALAPFGARLYGASEITQLAWVVAVAMPLGALSTIPVTALRVSLNFRHLAMVGTAEMMAIQLLSVVLAWGGMGAYSFVIPMPVVAAAKAGWLWISVRPRLRLNWPRRSWLYLVRSGFSIWGYRLLTGLISQGDYFVLGLTASRNEVGFYFFAFRFAAQPLQALAANLYSVMYPIIAQLRLRPEEQCRTALKSSQVLLAAVFFAAGLQVALAPSVLHLLFHDRWDGSILLIQVLSIGLAFDAVPWIAAALINARGEFRRNLGFVLFSTPGFFLLVGVGAWLGHTLGVAIAVGIYYAIFAPIYSYAAMRSGGVKPSVILRLFLPPMMLAASVIAAVYGLTRSLFHDSFVIAQMASILVLATALYAALMRLCLPQTFSSIKTQIWTVISGRP